jgi:hypothetical protein
MLAMLKSGRSKDLENVVAHSQPSYSHPTGNLPTGVSFASDNTGYSGLSSGGPSFFERLFGGPTPPPGPAGRRPQQRRLYER